MTLDTAEVGRERGAPRYVQLGQNFLHSVNVVQTYMFVPYTNVNRDLYNSDVDKAVQTRRLIISVGTIVIGVENYVYNIRRKSAE